MRDLRACAVVAVLLAVAGCSDDTGSDAAVPPAPLPSALGDRPRVEVLDAGAEPRRSLRLAVEQGEGVSSTLVVDQQVAADPDVTDLAPITLLLEAVVTRVADDEIGATLTYGDVQVDDPALRRTLAAVAGASDEIVLGPDGYDDTPAATDPVLAQVRSQVLSLVPVLPGEAVGVGSTWTVVSVVDVDGATVDRTATYTLDALDGDAYVIGVSSVQEYRTGEVEGVEVTAGRGNASGRFEGSLASLLPTTASLDLGTQVTYDVGAQVSEVQTTVALDLTSR